MTHRAPEGWRPKGGVSQVTFVSREVGWLFGPSLFVTRDGGGTWHKDSVGAEVIALEAIGDSVWAATRTCAQNDRCIYGLLVSTDGGDSWSVSDASVDGPLVRIERIGADMGLIVSYGFDPNGRAHNDRIIATLDGGATWHGLPSPCPYHYSIDVALSAADASNLWVLCGFEASGGSQKKIVRLSDDGGKTWGPRVSSPYGGSSFALAGLSERDAVITGGGFPLTRTNDGGRSWDIKQSIADDAGWGVIEFVDEEHGWASNRDLVLRTADGGRTWKGSFVVAPRRCAARNAISADVDGDEVEDLVYNDYLHDKLKGGAIVGVCTAIGVADRLPSLGQGELLFVGDVEPDGRHEIFYGATSLLAGHTGIAVFRHAQLNAVRTVDGESLVVIDGLDFDIDGREVGYALGCEDVAGDDAREPVQVTVEPDGSVVHWKRVGYALKGAMADVVYEESGTRGRGGDLARIARRVVVECETRTE